MFAFKTLQRRLNVLLIVPLTLFLLGFGVFGYRYIQSLLFKEWSEVAILRLERAAHQMEMKLHEQMEWMDYLGRAGRAPDGQGIQRWLLAQMQTRPGVREVIITWKQPAAGAKAPATRHLFTALSPVEFFYPPDRKSVGLRAELLDQARHPVGRLEVLLSYDYLIQDVLKEGWLVAQMACLVTEQGTYLAHSSPAMQGRHCLGETQDPLELAMLKSIKDKPYGTLMSGGYIPARVIGYYKLQVAPWAIMLHARGSQILAPILSFRIYFLGSGLLCLAVILFLIRLGVRPVVVSIRRIADKAARVARGDYGEPLAVPGQDEIGLLTARFNDMIEGLKEKDFISNTFGRYVDQEVARELLSRPEAGRLGGVKREVVILFADIRGFTPLAETLSPEAIISLVNRHFARMIDVIQARRGIIVDFLGDAILAFFDPLDGPLEPVTRRAIQAALKLQTVMAAENLADPSKPPLNLGVGLHAGEVVVGNIGSESRAKYGIIGAPVNLTHRIQGQAQGGEVVISDRIFQYCADALTVKRSFQAKLKGIAHPVTLYVVENLTPQSSG